jgi:hypothetical protein
MARIPTKLKNQIPKMKIPNQPRKLLTHSKAQRVVVDEILDIGVARILRADRMPGFKANDLTIQSWSDEKEDFIEPWKIEAFVGFTKGRKLREGDVFFIKDGSLLNKNYRGKKIIERTEARKKHLIERIDDSIESARWEIKDETRKLTADHLATSKAEKKKLHKIITAQKKSYEEFKSEIPGELGRGNVK